MNNERYNNFSLELDCEPGPLRPHHLIGQILQDSGLSTDDFETRIPVFGHQSWILKEGDLERDNKFTKGKRRFAKRIAKLYNEGHIRYGSW